MVIFDHPKGRIIPPGSFRIFAPPVVKGKAYNCAMSNTELDNLLQDAFTQLAALRNLLELAYTDRYYEKDVLLVITDRINNLNRNMNEICTPDSLRHKHST